MFHEYKLLTSQNDYIINNLGLSFRFPTKGILPKDSGSVGNLFIALLVYCNTSFSKVGHREVIRLVFDSSAFTSFLLYVKYTFIYCLFNFTLQI